MKKFYLKDSDGYIIAKFEMENDDWFDGSCYICVGWSMNAKPIDWLYHCGVSAKSDGCSHWYFRGEDYNKESDEYVYSYYHLCGRGCFENHIILMCFVWKLAMDYWVKKDKDENRNPKYTKEDYNTELIEYMLKGYEIIEEYYEEYKEREENK